jgi:hypothetical protein
MSRYLLSVVIPTKNRQFYLSEGCQANFGYRR